MAAFEGNAAGSADISIYGQESNYTIWRLAKMNLAIRGIGSQIAHGDTFHDDRVGAELDLRSLSPQRSGFRFHLRR